MPLLGKILCTEAYSPVLNLTSLRRLLKLGVRAAGESTLLTHY